MRSYKGTNRPSWKFPLKDGKRDTWSICWTITRMSGIKIMIWPFYLFFQNELIIPRRSETQRNAIRERSRPDFGDDFGLPAESRGFLRTDDGRREKRKHWRISADERTENRVDLLRMQLCHRYRRLRNQCTLVAGQISVWRSERRWNVHTVGWRENTGANRKLPPIGGVSRIHTEKTRCGAGITAFSGCYFFVCMQSKAWLLSAGFRWSVRKTALFAESSLQNVRFVTFYAHKKRKEVPKRVNHFC